MNKNFIKSVVAGVASLGLIASCSMLKHSHKCHHGAKCSEKEESKGGKHKDSHKCASSKAKEGAAKK